MFVRARCFSKLWLIAFLMVGCRLPVAEVAGIPGPTAVVTPSPTPLVLPLIDAPTPMPGRATIYGQTLRPDGTPAVAVVVTFCQDFTLYGGCGEKQYRSTTAVDGTYIITGVEPGHYALVIYPEGETGKSMQFASDEALKATLFEVTRNMLLDIKPVVLFAQNLDVIGPMGEARLPASADEGVLTSEVKLQWELLSGATVYEVYLAPEKGEAVWVNERVEGGEVTAVLPRLDCAYFWHVSAFNQANMKIGETPGLVAFEVIGEEAGCDLTLLPPRLEEVELTSVKGVILDWAALATADHYNIWLVDDENRQRPPLLNWEMVSRSRYELLNGLLPSHYTWAVTAYDETGRMIAESEFEQFEVDEMGEIKNVAD